MADNISAFRPSYRPARHETVFSADLGRLLAVAAALMVGLTVLVAGWHVLRRTHAGVPVIEAQDGPVRTKPEHPGGMTVAGATDPTQDQTEKLAPPAEQPEIAALRAKLHAAQKKLARQQAELEHDAQISLRIAPAPPVQHAAALAPLSLTPAPLISLVQLPLIIGPTETRIAIQLAAFDTEEAARSDWAALVKKLPALHGRTPEVERAAFAGHPIWRLRTAGFASVASATSFCAKLRAEGTDCKLAAF